MQKDGRKRNFSREKIKIDLSSVSEEFVISVQIVSLELYAVIEISEPTSLSCLGNRAHARILDLSKTGMRDCTLTRSESPAWGGRSNEVANSVLKCDW